jgi:hypothetical protein
VLVLYGFTLALGVVALALVQASDRLAAVILVGLGLSLMLVIRKLGYVDYLTTKLVGWMLFSDVLGVEARESFSAYGRTSKPPSLEGLERLQSAGRQLNGLRQPLPGRRVRRRPLQADLGDAAVTQCDLPSAFDPCTTLRISMPVGTGHRLKAASPWPSAWKASPSTTCPADEQLVGPFSRAPSDPAGASGAGRAHDPAHRDAPRSVGRRNEWASGPAAIGRGSRAVPRSQSEEWPSVPDPATQPRTGPRALRSCAHA